MALTYLPLLDRATGPLWDTAPVLVDGDLLSGLKEWRVNTEEESWRVVVVVFLSGVVVISAYRVLTWLHDAVTS